MIRALLLLLLLAALGADADPLRSWWTAFEDPRLASLVERAVRANPDLRAALARIGVARGEHGVARSGLLPSVNGASSYTRVRGGFAQGLSGAGLPAGSPQGRPNLLTPFETSVYQAGFDAGWEIDLFGRTRKGVDAASAGVAAAEFEEAAGRVSVAAEVGRNYFELRGAQRRLDVLRESIEVRRQSLDLARERLRVGLAPELDVIRASAELAQTEAAVPPLEAEVEASIYRLSVLAGEKPEALAAELREPGVLPEIPAETPTGVPVDLLLRRPDVRVAGEKIAAAAALLGEAEADRYPRFLLSGLMGRQSPKAGQFTLGLGNFFSFGPAIRLPLFSGGRIRSHIAAREAGVEEAELGYESAALRAFEDVRRSISFFRHEQERRSRLERALADSRDSVALVTELYAKGLSDFLAVLDAQRQSLAIEDQFAQSETLAGIHLVGLYKALGGGW